MIENKIQKEIITKLIQEAKIKINKYIDNSRKKLEDPN